MSKESTERERDDEFARRYGYCRNRPLLRLRHDSGSDISIPLAYYDSFYCKRCTIAYGFFLPHGANPCPQHTQSICCECCSMEGLNSWCEDKATSYIMRV